MNKFNMLAVSVLAITLAGCGATAKLVKHPNKPLSNDFNPSGVSLNDSGVGIVSYKGYGSEDKLMARREKANELATKSCGGEFDVLKEKKLKTTDQFANTNSGEVSFNSFSSEHMYVIYKCK